ncbi:unnamed protein product, partial [Nesidiocoris tenuis]
MNSPERELIFLRRGSLTVELFFCFLISAGARSEKIAPAQIAKPALYMIACYMIELSSI